MRIRVLSRLAIAALVVCCAVTAARASQFLSAEIEAALAARSEFLRKVDLTDVDLLEFDKWIRTHSKLRLEERLERIVEMDPSEAETAWFYYLNGRIEVDSAGADLFYRRAITVSGGDPGKLWLLALEFLRSGQTRLAESALAELEKTIHARGAAFAPVIARQLMLMGGVLAQDSPGGAAICYDWAKRFDKDQSWSIYRKGVASPIDFMRSVPAFIADASDVAARSWYAQASILRGVYDFAARALFIFICMVFFVLFVKHLPVAAHWIGDLFFSGASPRVRAVLSVTTVVSTIIFGIIPFLWVGAFLIRRFVTGAEKKLMTAACVILAFTPLDAVFTNILTRHTRPDSEVVIFDRSVNEGYSDALRELAASGAESGKSYLAPLAHALVTVKNGEFRQSVEALDRAYQAAETSPVVLMHAGNISYWVDDYEAMEGFHSSLLRTQVNNAAAMYNLAQARSLMSGLASSDMIANAAKHDPALINEFMKTNARYYGDDAPPPLRQLIQPALTPGYFWRYIFFSGADEVLTVPGWNMFFGVNPFAAFALFAFLFIALLTLDTTLWNARAMSAGRYFTCRICGATLCRRCRKGTMCAACYKASLDSHNNASAMYNRQRAMLDGAQLRRGLTRSAVGMFVPGGESLYKGETSAGSIAAMAAASLFVAATYGALTFSANYPSATIANTAYLAPPLLIYNFVAFVKGGAGMIAILCNRAKQKEAQYGS